MSLSFILYLLTFIILGFGLSAFFLVPAYMEGKYTLRDIVTGSETMTRFVPFSWFFRSPWNYGGGSDITKEIGVMQWIGIVAALWVAIKTKSHPLRVFLFGTFFIFVVSLFMMTHYSVLIWEKVTLIQKFQFPWRFLSVSVFTSAVLGGIGVANILEMNKRHMNNIISQGVYVVFCICIITSTMQMWKPIGYEQKHDSFYEGIYMGTTDTGESSPVWSVRFMEHTPASPMEVISGSAMITPLVRKSTLHEYKVSAATNARILENTLFFPGWKVYVDDLGAGLQFQDPAYRGLMTFRLTEGDHIVRIVFGDTKVRWYADMISSLSLCILCLMAIGVLLWSKKTKFYR
jgi:hypothetical protein